MGTPLRALLAAVALLLLPQAGLAQGSSAALRFHGTGAGLDRARIPVDDNLLGPDASTGSDVGRGSFTIELWLRGEEHDNASPWDGEGSYADERWMLGQALLDRTLQSGSQRTYGLSLTGGRVAFFTGAGDGALGDTSVGSTPVLDDLWHHVALVRDAASGRKRIYVDGVLDYQSAPDTSRADLSYPDRGVAGAPRLDPMLIVGAAKYDQGPAFDGLVDELRLWDVARSAGEIAAARLRRMLPDTAGLVADWRFEEQGGTRLRDTSERQGRFGTRVPGLPGGSDWALRELDPDSVAPIAGSLPIGFEREELCALDRPTALEVAPGGRVFLVTQRGAIHTWTEGDGPGAPQLLLSLPVDFLGERGLLGLALDPQFRLNGWLYVFYTSVSHKSRVARLTYAAGAIAASSEQLLWESPDPSATEHQGGALHCGPDGKLYIATGDQSVPANAQDLGTLHGKILRLASDGSVPTDNPFVTTPFARPEIWALGLRNPFRFRFDMPTGRAWIGDVGANGAQAWEEIDLLERGANYGWPLQEGELCHLSDCSALRASRFAYRHDERRYTGGQAQAALVCGPVYRGTAFPGEYEGSLFCADFANGWLRRLELDASGALVAERPFELAPDEPSIVDLAQSPEGALYLLRNMPGALLRIRYTGLANVAPVPEARATPAGGPAPLRVRFAGSGSIDPDQGPRPIGFSWDFGDGSSTHEADPVHTYATRGLHLARLTVSDGNGTATSEALEIAVGHAPLVRWSAPAPSTLYRAGQTIDFAALASDEEDGPLGPAAFEWNVVLVHESHRHPVLGPLTGVAAGSFTVPASGHGPAHTHYEIQLAVRDSDGLVTRVTRDVLPRVATLALRSDPPGATLALDGEPYVTPRDYPTLEGFVHQVRCGATLLVDGRPYEFDSWQHGPTQVQVSWIAPAGGGELRARYRPVDRASVTVSVSAPERNAQWQAATGQVAGDAADDKSLCAGRDNGPLEAAFEFALPIPRGAIVESACLELFGTAPQLGSPRLELRAFATGNAPPFVFGSPTALSAWLPLGERSVDWSGAPWRCGDWNKSPELAALVQAAVARRDWSRGNFLGLVLQAPASGAALRARAGNFASGSPARLRVTWRPPPEASAHDPLH